MIFRLCRIARRPDCFLFDPRSWQVLVLLCSLTAVVSMTVSPAAAQHVDGKSGSIDLTAEEKSWIEVNPVAVVAIDNEFPPINFVAEDGELVGMAVDLLKTIEQKVDLSFEVQTGPWRELIDRAMAHDVDAILNADATESRRERLLFTDVYFPLPQAIVVRRSEQSVSSLDDLRGKTVALLSGTSHVEYFARNYPDINIVEVDSMMGRFEAVQARRASATIGALPVINQFIESNLLTSFKIAGLHQSESLDNLRIAVRNTAPELWSILNKGIASLSSAELSKINEKWLPRIVVELLQGTDHARLNLTDVERSWLIDHPVIRVAADIAWPPIEYVNAQGMFQGIAIDYLNRVSESLGIRFEFDTESNWSTVVEKLKDRELDMFSAAAFTPSRAEFAAFTRPYLSLSQVVFTRDDAPFYRSLDDLIGERLAVVKGYAIGELLRRDYPDIDLFEVRDLNAGIDAVRAGRVVGFVGGIMNVGFQLRSRGIEDVKVSTQTPYSLNLAMAARSDWPILRGILQKAIDAIPQSEQETIRTAWSGPQVRVPPDYTLALQVAGSVIMVILLLWLLQMYRQRKTMVAAQTALAIAHRDAERANAAKSEFLATMSHEFRTPLNAILGFSEMLRGQYFGPLGSDNYREYVEDIHLSGQHMLALINDILDISAIEAGKSELMREPLDVRVILQGCLKSVQPLANRKSINLQLDADRARLPILADRRALTQIVFNLLSNAVKFTDNGGSISLNAETVHGGTAISVVDSGRGIPRERLAKITEPFERVSSDPHLSGEGTGLGLAIVQLLADQHGAELRIESEIGQGTTVTVVFP